MRKIVWADKDSYITDRVISGESRVSASVGAAASLDLFKLYGMTFSGSVPNVELSRLLVHFDLSSIRTALAQGRMAIDGPTFSAVLVLKDVYGGQTTPANFTIDVFPLSRSFDEGLGRDIVQYSDEDVCNFISCSRAQGAWLGVGCAQGGFDSVPCDFITGSHGVNLRASQEFVSGFEDLQVDVTTIVSATLAGTVPDEGFRVSFSSSHESDSESYFVKRFAARTAHDPSYHPRLVVGYDDSVQDETSALTLDDDFTLVLRNYSHGRPASLASGSSSITGSNCLMLKLRTEISGGYYELGFTGSQHARAGSFVEGIYSASVHVPSSDTIVRSKLDQSGSFTVVPIWASLDGTVSFLTGSTIKIPKRTASSRIITSAGYTVTTSGVTADIGNDETRLIRVHFFDPSTVQAIVRKPIETKSIIFRDAFYSIRDAETGERVIPFDSSKGSTRLSSDDSSMFFELDASSLIVGRRYVIDAMLYVDGRDEILPDASPAFRVRAS